MARCGAGTQGRAVTRTTVVARAAVLLFGLALPGCTGPQDAPGTVGPAHAYLELVLGVTQEEFEAHALAFEEDVAECMAEAGFEYVPWTGRHTLIDDSRLDPPRGSREFAEAYGYGWAATPTGTTLDPVEDPNSAIQGRMSEAELAEYELALYGTIHLDYLDAEDQYNFVPDLEHAGCFGHAQLERDRSGDPMDDDTYLALQAEIDRIEAEVIPTHPDVVAADAAWSACMADAGYPGYARQPEAEEREFDHYMASGSGAGEVLPDGMTQGEIDQLAREIPIALADWDCADAVGYHDVVAGIRNAAQQEYVDAHRDELDAWVERWTEQTRG